MDKIEIGYVARAHGVTGELRIELHDPTSTTLERASRVWFGGVERALRAVRRTQGAFLVSLDGVTDRDAADRLKGTTIEVLRSDVPLEEGEYLIADLVGCQVQDDHGRSLGHIVEVWHGAQDILVIRDETEERLLPLVPAFVTAVELGARTVRVVVPDDLPAEPLAKKKR
jgi:16S rRNA processing protein RimM